MLFIRDFNQARQSLARRCLALRCTAARGEDLIIHFSQTWPGRARPGIAWQRMARIFVRRFSNTARQGDALLGKARRLEALHGVALRGMAKRGKEK